MPALLVAVVEVLTWLGWCLTALQTLVACGFVSVLLTARRRLAADADCPRALVVLCLRGADPFLRRCLEGLLAQDYPDYEILIIVDSRKDPAWKAVEGIIGACRSRKVSVEELRDRPHSCSLKNASLIQAYRELDPSIQIVATIDADCAPHPTWLRELVAPLQDPRVGAATGNRWYMPETAAWGGLVRYTWNMAAIVPMYWHKIAWGGSLALRAEFVRGTDYCQRMSKTLCEDTMLYDVLRSAGLRLKCIPSLLMINRESCDIGSYVRFCRRQMLIVRYHSQVWAIWGHGLISTAFFALAIVGCLAGLVAGQGALIAPLAMSLGLYVGSMFLFLGPLEWAARRIVRARGEPTDWLTPRKLLRLVPALFLTQSLYGLIAWSLPRAKRVDWRGIRYTLQGMHRVRRENYEPYVAVSEDEVRLNRSL